MINENTGGYILKIAFDFAIMITVTNMLMKKKTVFFQKALNM